MILHLNVLMDGASLTDGGMEYDVAPASVQRNRVTQHSLLSCDLTDVCVR